MGAKDGMEGKKEHVSVGARRLPQGDAENNVCESGLKNHVAAGGSKKVLQVPFKTRLQRHGLPIYARSHLPVRMLTLPPARSGSRTAAKQQLRLRLH
jgi:hypothetical protein